jgi:hypothetical protein
MRLTEGKCDRKIPDGKMIRVRAVVEMEGDKIKILDVGICGDFFMYPEETVEVLERIAVTHGFEENMLRSGIRDYLDRGQVETFGITAEDISDTVLAAIEEALVLGKKGGIRSSG